MNVGTYDIKELSFFDFSSTNWFFRRRAVSDLILKYSLDVCAVQGVNNSVQRRSFVRSVNANSHGGVFSYYGGYSGILYRSDLFSVLECGMFSLSGGFVSWVKLYDYCNRGSFYFFSVHLSKGDHASMRSMLDVLRGKIRGVISDWSDVPIFIGGSFNFHFTPRTALYKKLVDLVPGLHDSNQSALLKVNDTIGTYNGFRSIVPSSESRFDYLLSSCVRQTYCNTVAARDSNRVFPSDHFPVVMSCEFESPGKVFVQNK